MSGELKQALRRKSSFVQTMKAVAWSFFGVRKGSDLAHDAEHLNPLHLVIAGVIGALVFIGVLLAVVNVVLASSAAG